MAETSCVKQERAHAPEAAIYDGKFESVAEMIEWTIAVWGGPAQFLQAVVTCHEAEFVPWLQDQLPAPDDIDIFNGKPPSANVNVWCAPFMFGFDADASTKPAPFPLICRKIACEVDTDGFVTASEPLRAFVRADYNLEFGLGHVRGMARFSVLLGSLAVVWKFGGGSTRISVVLPKLYATARAIYTTIEQHSTLTSVALRNATLSHRGSIRQAHDAITWVGKLMLLQEKGSDASAIIKQYNSQASANAQLSGGKRTAVLAMLGVQREATDVVLACVGKLGDASPWTDDAWSNKKIMPGHAPRLSSPTWSRRCAVTTESFLLMLKWQSKSQEKKLPQLRRKLDKVAMEEGAQLCAVLTSLQADLLASHPIQVDEWNKSIVEPFIEGSDMNLLLGLQSVLHAKPECPVVELLPQFQEMLTAHTSQ